MSPYRVLVKRANGEFAVRAAMLSIDRKSDRHNIYIVSKYDEPMFPIYSHKELAHKQTTRANSEILRHYIITRGDDENLPNRYNIHDLESNVDFRVNNYTQSECLVSAMMQYCKEANLTVVQEL